MLDPEGELDLHGDLVIGEPPGDLQSPSGVLEPGLEVETGEVRVRQERVGAGSQVRRIGLAGAEELLEGLEVHLAPEPRSTRHPAPRQGEHGATPGSFVACRSGHLSGTAEAVVGLLMVVVAEVGDAGPPQQVRIGRLRPM